MAVKVYENVVSKDQRKILLDYFKTTDDLVDSRPDVRSKTPVWNQTTNWPQDTVKQILDDIIKLKYDPEWIFFYMLRQYPFRPFPLHVDSGDGDQSKLHKNILIPLDLDGPATTIVFKNKWHGPSTRFGTTNVSPFRYEILNHGGAIQVIEDIRELKDISHLRITQEELDRLIEVRSGKTNQRVTDYTNIEGYDPNIKFDKQIHQQYLSHIPIENLHGLTIDSIIEWKLGDVITFDRQHLHSAGCGHSKKIGLTVTTNVGD